MLERPVSSLLSAADLQAARQSRFQNLPLGVSMGVDELQSWKQKVANFQKTAATRPQAEQGTLFDLALTVTVADPINPFQLPRQNTEFWRWQFDDAGVAALYFVIDYSLDLLLYIGETIKSNQRWQGVHDCKRYLLNYRQVHYQHQLDSQLGIAFWSQAPTDRRLRQQLESDLIYQWRSPFNKENWSFWATPFVGGHQGYK